PRQQEHRDRVRPPSREAHPGLALVSPHGQPTVSWITRPLYRTRIPAGSLPNRAAEICGTVRQVLARGPCYVWRVSSRKQSPAQIVEATLATITADPRSAGRVLSSATEGTRGDAVWKAIKSDVRFGPP